MMLESKVKSHLFNRVKEQGGIIRNVKWIGRIHCPDTRVMLPWICAWVETKRPGKDARKGQAREHERMRKYGEVVEVLDTIEKVDRWLLKTYREAMRK